MNVVKSIFNLLKFNSRNWRAVALCVFAATVFWFFNALNKNYTSNISFPLAFDYDHQNYIAVKPLPRKIRVNVTGNGWDLFRKSAGLKVPPLVIPLERPVEVRKIVGSTLPALFSSQLEALQINFIVTDTVYVNIERKAHRWLKIQVDSIRQYIHPDYGVIGPVRIIPDSVFLEGPTSLINNLRQPYYLKLPDRDIDENYTEDVEVQFNNGHLINRNPPFVAVRFNVEKFVEFSDSLKIELKNVPRRISSRMGKGKVLVVWRCPQHIAESYQRNDSARAVIDVQNLKRGHKKILPHVTGLPVGAEIVRLDSIPVIY